MHLDQDLVDAARELLERRFPGDEGITAAMYTENGDVLTSVFFEPEWGSGMLCAETGAICEAEKLGKRVTAFRRRPYPDPDAVRHLPGAPVSLGSQPRSGRPRASDPTRWMARTLKEVQPYYWVNAFEGT
jgi:cytidine deaminase